MTVGRVEVQQPTLAEHMIERFVPPFTHNLASGPCSRWNRNHLLKVVGCRVDAIMPAGPGDTGMAKRHAIIWEDEMFGSSPTFSDREDAGRQLAEAMLAHPLHDPVVMALPRGGVPVAFEVAQRLGIPLDLLIVRKIGAPGHPEYGIGAVVDGREPHVVISEDAARHFRIPPGYIATECDHQIAEIERRHRIYFGEDEPEQHDHSGRDIILVDDGIANGGSIRAGIHALKEMGVGSIRIAVPVAPRDLLEALKDEVDEIVCLSAPEKLDAVSLHYGDFSETTDQDVVRLLKQARRVNRTMH